MADFAKSQLMKYGWTEGKGLGKNETGITEALKPKLKFDVAGIGHKDDDSNNWWESAFNKAADNIIVESQAHGVLISVSKKSTSNEPSKEVLSAKKSKHEASYGKFLKTSVLLDGNLINESNSNLLKVEQTVEDVTRIPLTDEELFKVCGGRTAHKGARHGLTLNGKLKRIAQQEENLLGAGIRLSNTLQDHNKYQEHECEIDNNENTLLPVSLSLFHEQTPRKVSKNLRKKTKRRINDLTHQLNVLCNVSDNDERSKQSASDDAITKNELKLKRKRKKKGKKGPLACDVEVVEKEGGDKEIEDASFPVSAKLEKEIIEKRVQGKLSDHGGEVFENVSTHEKKKKKSRRKKDENYQEGNIINICEDANLDSSRAKKYKMSHQSDGNLQLLTEDDDFNMLENKFKTKISCTEPFVEPQEVGDSSVKYLKNEADRLNARITKKKRTKYYRKQKIRLDKITESLEAVHFDTEKSTERKSAKKKLDTLVETMIETSIAIDKTECLKKTAKKKKKK
ncbi:uncharacterized protein LOC143374793 [Andrena cerasifolii]|uniref:uncharacterized protein LOC143374793 n=1 Tax=Andrena cerasifolii TaxID=2819439 RepID=UPI0040383EEB